MSEELQDTATEDAPDKMEQIHQLLEVLVPKDTEFQIEDIYGNAYTLPTKLPARRQIKVLRHLQELMALESTADSLTQLPDMFTEGNIAGGIAMLLSAVEDDKVMGKLEGAFTEAYPDVLTNAQKAHNDKTKTKAKQLPADLFTLEDIAQSMIPFLSRLINTMVGMATKVMRTL